MTALPAGTKLNLKVGDRVVIEGGKWFEDYGLPKGTIVNVVRIDGEQAIGDQGANCITNWHGKTYSNYPISLYGPPTTPLPELLLQAQEQFADFTAGLVGMVKQLEDAGFPHEQATVIVTSIFVQSTTNPIK